MSKTSIIREYKQEVNMRAQDVLNADEVSMWLRIPKSTLYKLCSEGQIPCTKIGKHWRFERGMVKNWFENKVRENITNHHI